MSNEASVQAGLSIRKGTSPVQIDYASRPTAYTADVAGAKGPVPGAIEASVTGTNVDFSELTQPALCTISNLDGTNFVTYGIWDPEGDTFYPLGEVLPGETNLIRLSRDLQEEFGTGTGTTGADTNRLRVKADTAPVSVFIGAFEV